MANGHGGSRTPANPAPVSGPGALSARTDGGPTSAPPMMGGDGSYGDRADMMEIQGGAAMGPATAGLPGLMDPGSGDIPLTQGADAGAGLGMQAAGISTDEEITNEKLRPLVRSLETMANLPTSNPETRAFVRQLKARLGTS